MHSLEGVYLFRGKSLISPDWVYGSVVSYNNQAHIVPAEAFDQEITCQSCAELHNMTSLFTPVIPATVGMFTRLHDKKLQMIYHGDLLANERGEYGVVLFMKDWAAYYWSMIRIRNSEGDLVALAAGGSQQLYKQTAQRLTNIGNMWDNVDLLRNHPIRKHVEKVPYFRIPYGMQAEGDERDD